MCNLRVGMKVVCVDVPWPADISRHLSAGVSLPVPGQVYTIRWAGISEDDGNLYVRLDEIVNPVQKWPGYRAGEARFGSRRFRPVVTRKTDISIFTDMLTDTKVEERA